MMYAERLVIAVAVIATLVTALPNHLKVVLNDPIPKVPAVSASIGGYSASAGLGGDGSSGGLFASADSPHGSASAGLGGDSSSGGLFASAGSPHGSAGAGLGGSVPGASSTDGVSSSASTGDSSAVSTNVGTHTHPGSGGHKPVIHTGPTLFDNIFNIPISVLQSVNAYLNNREPIRKPIHRRRGHHPDYKVVTPDSSTEKPAIDSGADNTSGHGAEAGTNHGPAVAETGSHLSQGPVVLQKRVNYDAIFDIPISALKSVNHLLNNGKK